MLNQLLNKLNKMDLNRKKETEPKKELLEIKEVLILPPLDMSLFLSLYDGKDQLLLDVLLQVEKEIGKK